MSRNYQNHPELYPEVSSIDPDVHYFTNTMTRTPAKASGFKVVWQTSLGRFGWVSFEDARNIDEVMSAFQAARRDDADSSVPFDACIDTIKPIA